MNNSKNLAQLKKIVVSLHQSINNKLNKYNMRIKQLFLILALLCAMVQGAWAQASWDEVYAITNTTSANWTALPEGTTAGATISPSTTPLPATASGAAKHKEIPRGSRRMAATSAVSIN